MRAFLALELPDALRQSLAALRTREPVRWVAPAAIHLTIRFLGEVDEARVPALIASLLPACAATPPLSLTLRGGGAFGPRGRPRALWVGVEGDAGPLAALAAAVEAAVAAQVGPADHPFRPHVTVGRVREGRADEAVRTLAAAGHLGSFVATELVLFASELRPGGAVHTPVARLPLAG